MAYRYKTKPLNHQKKAFSETANLAAYGLLWSQGVGKTKPLIDTASYLYLEGKIKALLVVAPNGVHRNWISDEIPAHMPEEVRKQVMYVLWQSVKFKNKSFQKQLKDLMKHEGLAIVLIQYEACITDNFKAWGKKFLDSRPTLMVLDESHRIKTSTSKVKTTLVAFGGHVPYRRIASGTPLERPFDLYPQFRFLDPTFWKVRGFPTYSDFKAHFGVFANRTFGARSFEQLVGHKNLDELSDLIQEMSWRLTKEDAGLNLPPKVYSKRYCTLTPEQSRVYNELRDKFRVQLESGDELVASSAITRLLRLQQVICGYVSVEADQPVQRIDANKNPRMDLACDEILSGLTHQAIIWHRFTADIDEMCRRLGNKCVRYDGKVDNDGRALAKRRFQDAQAQFFVCSKAASTGLTLVGAKTAVYYSNSFGLIDRLQSEDRCHRIGQTVSVDYIDLIAEGTVDEFIVQSLRKKMDIFSQVLQDDIRSWI